ncbi:MAG: ATP-binding cassette domain-containing protein [Archangium sp.]|nr:ATP-binding cassette domain-containing protein [Archangium sp.]
MMEPFSTTAEGSGPFTPSEVEGSPPFTPSAVEGRVPGAEHLEFRKLSVRFGAHLALDEVSFTVPRHTICAVVGPANSGKSSLLKCINRTLDFEPRARVSGEVLLDGEPVSKVADVLALRRRVGMVFPLPVGLPMSVYDNVAWAPRSRGVKRRADLDVIVEQALRQAVLWDEVKDRLDLLGTRLSGGQQQRLTLARALSMEPEVLCLDEFSIAIDPVTTMKIEEVLLQLKATTTVVLSTNLVQQARRLADQVVFLNASRLVECGDVETMFHHPSVPLTSSYLHGAIG